MKRKLSLLMALILVLSSSTVVFGQSSDYASNWAKDEISYMVGKGIINGYPDGTFKPTNNMSKAEFYTVINGLVGYSEKAEVEYEDVNPGSWYYGEVQKASKANYLPTGKILNPEDKITRGEVARIIGNVFGIEEDVVSANKFVDGGKLPKEIKGIVGGLRKGGYIAGYPDGTFRHESEISRAEVVKMLHTVSGEIVNEASTINKDAKTNLVVSTKDVVLKDMVIEGNLYLTEGIGEGDVTLDNVEVKGELSIKGGGENSIIIKNSKINKVSIGKQQGRVRVVFENTTVNQVTTLREVKIELTNETKIETVELDGKVELAVGEGTAIDTLSSVSKEVNIESKGTIESIKTKEDVKVNGKVVKSGTEVKVDAGKTKEVKPKETPKQETTRPSSSGGWGGSSGQTPRPTPTVVSAISVDVKAITLGVGETATITATVEPDNATNKNVTWTTSDAEIATVANGVVTAVAKGEATITATAGGKTAEAVINVLLVATPEENEAMGEFLIGWNTLKPYDEVRGNHVSYQFKLNEEIKELSEVKVSIFKGGTKLATNTLIEPTKYSSEITEITGSFYTNDIKETSSWNVEPISGNLGDEIFDGIELKLVLSDKIYTINETELRSISGNVMNLNKYSGYESINEAIAAASAGDVIIVGDGEYTENLTINKAITLKSLNGRESTEIAGTITITAADDVTVEGFTVTAQGHYAVPVIHMNNLENVNILNNSVVAYDTAYGAIGTSDGPAKVTGKISGNTVTGMIMVGTDGAVEVSNNNVTLTPASTEGICFYPVGLTAEITVTGNTVGAVTEGNVQIKVNERPASVNEKTTAVEMLAAISADNNGATAKLAWLSDSIAVIGATGYSTLQAAIDAAVDGDTINILSDVSFVGITTDAKSLTFMGTDAKPSIGFPVGQYNYQTYYGCDFTFENLTLNFDDNNYQGIQPDKLVARNCVINGKVFGYPKEMEFKDCVFNQTSSYNIWTYGSDVTFDNCEFNSAGRSVLIYNEGATQDNPAKIVFNECEFINKGEVVSEKAAIEISTYAYPDKAGSFIVEIDNCSATGFDTETPAGGVVLSPGLAHLKEIGVGTLTVTIDGQEMYPVMVK